MRTRLKKIWKLLTICDNLLSSSEGGKIIAKNFLIAADKRKVYERFFYILLTVHPEAIVGFQPT
jgi:hypothetical protein